MPKYTRGLFLLCLNLNLVACIQKPTVESETRNARQHAPGVQTPIPGFLKFVYPVPGSQLTQDAYTTGIGDEENRLFDQLQGAICVDLIPANLLEQNDQNLDSEDFVAASYLRVGTYGSNSQYNPVRHDRVWVSESGGVLVDEKGNIIGASLIACWMADLSPGVYEANYEYTRTSGRVLSYAWSFEIAE